MYDERQKMKRDTQQKSSLFPERRTAFLSGISLHFQLFVVRYGFRNTGLYIPLCFLVIKALSICFGDLGKLHLIKCELSKSPNQMDRAIACPWPLLWVSWLESSEFPHPKIQFYWPHTANTVCEKGIKVRKIIVHCQMKWYLLNVQCLGLGPPSLHLHRESVAKNWVSSKLPIRSSYTMAAFVNFCPKSIWDKFWL